MKLTAEAEGVDFREFTFQVQEPAEGGIGVFRNMVSGGVRHRNHVLVAVRDVVKRLLTVRHRQRHIEADRLPGEGSLQCVIVECIVDRDQLVAVVDVLFVLGQHSVTANLLFEAAAHIVVVGFEAKRSLFRRNQPVFIVPGVAPAVPGQHVAVGVIARLLRVDPGILVEVAGGINGCRAVFFGGQAVADAVDERIFIFERTIFGRGCRVTIVTIISHYQFPL